MFQGSNLSLNYKVNSNQALKVVTINNWQLASNTLTENGPILRLSMNIDKLWFLNVYVVVVKNVSTSSIQR